MMSATSASHDSHGAVVHGVGSAWRWAKALRTSRPFWGGIWVAAAGAWILYSQRFVFSIQIVSGWSRDAGLIIGVGLIVLGLGVLIAPYYRGLIGILAWVVALGAFPAVNAGGYLLGSLMGVLGGSMILAWGPKKPRQRGLSLSTRFTRPASARPATLDEEF